MRYSQCCRGVMLQCWMRQLLFFLVAFSTETRMSNQGMGRIKQLTFVSCFICPNSYFFTSIHGNLHFTNVCKGLDTHNDVLE